MKTKSLFYLLSVIGAVSLSGCSKMDCESRRVTNLDDIREQLFCTDPHLPSLQFTSSKDNPYNNQTDEEFSLSVNGTIPNAPYSDIQIQIVSDLSGLSVSFDVTVRDVITNMDSVVYKKILKRNLDGHDTWSGEVYSKDGSIPKMQFPEQAVSSTFGFDTDMLDTAELLLAHFKNTSAPYPTLDPELAKHLQTYLDQPLQENLF